MIFGEKAKSEFNIEPVVSVDTDKWISECVSAYQGNPCWIDEKDHIDSVNFAKSICSEIARLTTLGIKIQLDGSARAEWIQKQIDSIFYQLRPWVEYGCAYGTAIIKPNGTTIELYLPNQFEITHYTGDKIDGVVFHNWRKEGDKWYTRLEYHRFEGGAYLISNKCYEGDAKGDTKRAVDIKDTPWADLAEEARISNVEQPLFGVFRTPYANNIDIGSPLGLPAISEAIQELRDLDIAYSRNAKEILDSKRTVLLDSERLLPMITPGRHGNISDVAMLQNVHALGRGGLPDYVKLVDGDTSTGSDIYHEINPQLNTEVRMKGINALLSQVGYKAGFSNGHFVFNEQSGVQTATQVEADQQRTIQLIKDFRDQLESCVNGLIYALNGFGDLYGLAPQGAYEAVFDFGDITYNREEDKARWWSYVQSGKVPAWMYFVKFEGMTEEDAKAMVKEATPKTPALFGGEE